MPFQRVSSSSPHAGPLTVGERVRSLRTGRGWSQGKLGREAGLSQPTVANFERGRTTGGLALTISKLAKALNVDPDWLRTGKGDPTRRLAAETDEDEAVAIYRALTPGARIGWMAAGRAMIVKR